MCGSSALADENAKIVLVERGPYLSYANCGLPYHVSDVIPREASLMVANEQVFRGNFAIDARTNCEAIAVSPQEKTVDLRDVATGEVTTEAYDKLVLSPGAASIKPPLSGSASRKKVSGIYQLSLTTSAETTPNTATQRPHRENRHSPTR